MKPFFFSALPIIRSVLLSLILFTTAATAKYSELFKTYQIDLSYNVNQAVLSAELLPQAGKELIVVGVGEAQQRFLSIFSFDLQTNTYIQQDKIKIDNNVFAYDVGDPLADGSQRLYLLDKAAVYQYVPAHLNHPSTWTKAESVSSLYLGEYADSLANMDFVHDINGDGLDDIILPHFEQLNLWLSDCCGARHPQQLPVAARIEIRDSKVIYDDQEVYYLDMNDDTQPDLVTVEQGYLNVFMQSQTKQFTATPEKVRINPSIHAVDWWEMKGSNGQEMDQSDIQHRVVRDIADFNGDGIPDMAVQFTKSAGVLDKTIDFEFYYGTWENTKLAYAQQASSSVTSKETLSDPRFLDLDMDGKLEVTVSSFDIGISQIVGALLSGSIDQDVLVFSMDDNNQYGKKPFVTQEVEITFSLTSGTRGQPLVRMVDINGDGVKDIVYSDGDDLIRAVLATPNDKKPYARRSLRQKIAMPKNPYDATTDDLNGDGKTDLVLHHGPADSAKSLRKVSVLIAN